MLLKKLELQNYGLYLGLHIIDFPFVSDKQPITLIGGLNGRGKTTILEAIFLVLYGKRVIRYLQDERISYSEYLYNHINKSASEKIASIALTIAPDDQENTVTIQRSWSIGKGSISDNFTAMKNGAIDDYLSENWDYYIEEVLPLNISRFFFFDGEKIAQIADDDSFESVKDSIKSLLGLTTVDQLIFDVNKMIKRISNIQPLEHDNTLSEISDIQNELEKSEKEISSSVATAARMNMEVGQLRKQNSELESEFWSKGGPLGLRREEFKAERHQLTHKLEVKMTEVDDKLSRSLTPLLLCRPLLERTFNQLHLDEAHKSSKYFGALFSQLSNLLSSSVYDQKSEELIANFLVTAKQSLLISPNPDSKYEMTPASQSLFEALISQYVGELNYTSNLVADIRSIENGLTQLEINLNFEVEASDVKFTWEKMRQLSSQIMQYESIIHAETEKQAMLMNKNRTLENRRLTIVGTSRQSMETEDMTKKLVRYATMTIDVMEKFKLRLQKERINELEKLIFDCFTFIGQKDQMISRIEIDPETLNIKLIDYLGGELLKNQLSAGEKQIFAVSILWGLAKASGYQMPVIVDTPLGRLDSNHRTNFLSSYLPYASKQVVVLSTDEEINGKYYNLIEPYINSVYLLEYNELMKSTSISNGYFGRQTQ